MLEALGVEPGRDLGAGGGDPAHDLGDVAGVVARVARVHALGREGQEEIAPHLEAGLLEPRQDELVRRARVGRALEDDEQPGLEVPRHLLGRRDDERHVGIAMLRERRGDAHVDGVHALERAEVRRRGEVTGADQRPHDGGRHVLDVGLAGQELPDPGFVDVDAGDVEAGLGEFDRQRQPDVAQSDHGQAGGAVFDLAGQGGGRGAEAGTTWAPAAAWAGWHGRQQTIRARSKASTKPAGLRDAVRSVRLRAPRARGIPESRVMRMIAADFDLHLRHGDSKLKDSGARLPVRSVLWRIRRRIEKRSGRAIVSGAFGIDSRTVTGSLLHTLAKRARS